MPRTSRFRVALTSAIDGAREATVSVERARGLVSVRLLRRRREYVLPLAWVAEAVIWKVIRAEVADRKAEKRKARQARRAPSRRPRAGERVVVLERLIGNMLR